MSVSKTTHRKTLRTFCNAALLSTLLSPLALFSLASQASLLYKIEGNNLEQPSYVFGTMHVLCQQDFKTSDSLLQAFADSEKVVMELNLSDSSVAQKMNQMVMNPEGPYLDQYLSPEQLTTLGDFVQAEAGVELTQIAAMRPFVISSMLVTQQLDCAQTASYELFLTMQAVSNQKPIIGLETVEYQFGIFDQIPLREQTQWLWEMAEDPEKSKNLLVKLKDTYLAENAEQLHQLIVDQPEYEEYTDMLLYQRNENWIDQLETEFQSAPTFVAVGAGHLGGERGVLQLLRDAGYSVTMVE